MNENMTAAASAPSIIYAWLALVGDIVGTMEGFDGLNVAVYVGDIFGDGVGL